MEKCGNLWLFFQADMAGLGKTCMGDRVKIGVFKERGST